MATQYFLFPPLYTYFSRLEVELRDIHVVVSTNNSMIWNDTRKQYCKLRIHLKTHSTGPRQRQIHPLVLLRTGIIKEADKKRLQ